MRDGSAHVLRCLKVWYDLPSDVFHTALANIDTFLAKMKVNILMTFYTFMLPSLQYKSLNHQGHLQPCLHTARNSTLSFLWQNCLFNESSSRLTSSVVTIHDFYFVTVTP